MTALTTYGRPSMAASDSDWPAAGHTLVAELRAHRSRVAVLTGTQADTDVAAARLAAAVGVEPTSLGGALADLPAPPTPADIERIAAAASVLVDLDVVFAPELDVDPIGLLHRLRRQHALLVAVWPGTVIGRRAVYSRPGRPDHTDGALTDAVVLRARPVRFEDEVPFTVERIAP